MNELKPEDVMRASELQVQRYLMPNVDIDGTVSVEDAERWFLKLLKEELAPYISALLREKDAEIERLNKERDKAQAVCVQMGKLGQIEVAKARAEAIREFEEKLKSLLIEGGIYPVFVKNAIEKVRKELNENATRDK